MCYFYFTLRKCRTRSLQGTHNKCTQKLLLCTGSASCHYYKMHFYRHTDATPLRRHMPLSCALPGRKHSLTSYSLLYLHSWLHSCAELAASHLCRLTQEPISPPVSSPMHTHSVGIWVCTLQTQSNNAYTDKGESFPKVIMHAKIYCGKGGNENETML